MPFLLFDVYFSELIVSIRSMTTYYYLVQLQNIGSDDLIHVKIATKNGVSGVYTILGKRKKTPSTIMAITKEIFDSIPVHILS